jgi:hypothetical protein
MPKEVPQIQVSRFAVDETPYCVWDLDIRQLNLDYLNSIDPRYFEHLAKMYEKFLEGDEKQYAATALRMAYSHGLESFFSLLCAAVQAPDCVVGWLLKYKNIELESVVRKITEWRRVNSKLKLDRVTWETLAELFIPVAMGDAEKDTRIKQAFSRLWARFAHDFLDEKQRLEYNSIKHGLRLYMGGFHLAMGLETTPGVPAPPERMQTVASSEFGSSYYVAERLHDGRNLRIRRQSINWNPENFFHALSLISTSTLNVLAILKAMNGVPLSELELSFPEDEAYFEEPWKSGGGFAMSMNSPIRAEFVKPLSKEQILSVYDLGKDDDKRDVNDEKDKNGDEVKTPATTD